MKKFVVLGEFLDERPGAVRPRYDAIIGVVEAEDEATACKQILQGGAKENTPVMPWLVLQCVVLYDVDTLPVLFDFPSVLRASRDKFGK